MTLAVPIEATVAPGQTITSAWANAGVRDAVNFLIAQPLFSGYQATVQSIAASTWTAAAIDATTIDTYGAHSNTVNNSRMTAQVAGWYECTGVCCFSNAQTTGTRNAMFQVNGGRYLGSAQDLGAGGDFPNVSATPTPIFLNAGDYVELAAYSSVATSLVVTLADLRTRFNARWVHS